MDDDRKLQSLLSSSIILLDKPCGPSSHEVSAFARKILGVKKAGHCGTLDPNVSGLLLVGVSRATRFLYYLSRADKEYIGMMKFHKKITPEQVSLLFSKFSGEITQTPPRESAVRKAPRKRKVYYLVPLQISNHHVLFHVKCQAGTYIRTLCSDMGKLCGGAHMHELRRVSVGNFGVEASHTLQELSDAVWLYRERKDGSALARLLLPIENFLQGYKRIVIKESACKNILSGSPLNAPGVETVDEGIKEGETVALVTAGGRLAAMARAAKPSDEIKKMKKGEIAYPKFVAMQKGSF